MLLSPLNAFIFVAVALSSNPVSNNLQNPPKESIRSKVSYGDVTGDGREEAIVVLGFLTGGSSMPNCVYVYAWDHGRPKLLWAFDTGDRAHGGLRRVKAVNGRLLVELYGDRKIIGKDFYTIDKTFRGACCPMQFTRAWYRWTGKGFRLASKPKVLPNPEGHGSIINN